MSKLLSVNTTTFHADIAFARKRSLKTLLTLYCPDIQLNIPDPLTNENISNIESNVILLYVQDMTHLSQADRIEAH